MGTSNYEIAKALWESFRNEVMFKRRFFLSHPVLDKLVEIAKGREVTIAPGKNYYRARIIDDAAARNEHMLAKSYGPNATEEERKWYRNKANKIRVLHMKGLENG